jgi:hypothetical protein
MSYPSETILSITAHGGIELTKKDVPTYFTVPEGIKITKLSAVVPGVCNLVSPDDTEEFNKHILEVIRKLEIRRSRRISSRSESRSGSRAAGSSKYKKMNRKTLEKMITFFQNTIKDTDNEVHKSARQTRRLGKPDVETEEYIFHSDKSYKVCEYKPGETIINKIYARNEKEIAGPWDLKINAMNVEGKPDLIQVIKGRRGHLRGEEDNTFIYLNEIVDFLAQQGVRHIILLDFSCSVFGREDDDFTNPEEIVINQTMANHLRRELIDKCKFGGSKARRRKRTKKNLTRRRSVKF